MAKVVVGMSGGVDSSVSAYLLKKKGYEVIGIAFKFISEFDSSKVEEVAQSLGIELKIVDYQKEFKELIIDNFINDYKTGITPNPCFKCNRFVKMQFLYQEMLNNNADYLATGHYAKMTPNGLYVSSDPLKDQTYFLASVPINILNKTLFPLEEITKDEVRKIALEIGLSNHNQKDSTDVCFINENFKDYLKKEISTTPGDIINIDTNSIVGKHNGLAFYTLGQRKGLNIGGTKDPLFVIDKDIKNNILYVGEGESNPNLYSRACIIDNINLLCDKLPNECNAKFRYHANDIKVTLKYLENNEILVEYHNLAKAVTPGQACVFYLENQCLGSGIIKEVIKKRRKIGVFEEKSNILH